MAYRGKHRKPSATGRAVSRVVVAGVAAGAPLAIAASPAQAAESSVNWDAIAQCESGGNWSISTGNGYFGGLQFKMSTWLAYGGTGNPASASRAEQIRVAENVLAGQGIGAWPVCGKKAGQKVAPSSNTTQKSTTRKSTEAKTADTQRTPKSAAQDNRSTAAPATVDGAYVVRSGDTLSGIAAGLDVEGGWRALHAKNSDTIKDPNLIYPGQQITIK